MFGRHKHVFKVVKSTFTPPAAMPTIQVDYMQVGHAQTFRVPMFAYREGELQPGTKVLLLGDGVDDQIGVIDCWSTDHQVQISLVTAA